MAEIGLGYGSEFQLLRFLGHHRNELDRLILESTGQSGTIKWLDYPYDDDKLSEDGELVGISCFEGMTGYKDIRDKWRSFWPQSGKAMNWDGICTIGDTWYFVEAKAHRSESFQECKASPASRIIIKKAFYETAQWLQAKPNKEWIDSDCYQVANRLAFLYFCNKCGIKARLLYIGFVNGFRRKKDEICSSEEWESIWKEEMDTLGLNIEQMKTKHIFFILPNCESHSC